MTLIIGFVLGTLIGGVGVFLLWMYDKERQQDMFEEMWWDDHHPNIPWPMKCSGNDSKVES